MISHLILKGKFHSEGQSTKVVTVSYAFSLGVFFVGLPEDHQQLLKSDEGRHDLDQKYFRLK